MGVTGSTARQKLIRQLLPKGARLGRKRWPRRVTTHGQATEVRMIAMDNWTRQQISNERAMQDEARVQAQQERARVRLPQ